MKPVRTDQEWSERHSNAVRAAAQRVPPISPHQQDELWQQIASVAAPDAGRGRRWRAVLAGVLAAGVLGVAGTAAANIFTAHTGKGPADAEELRLGGPGERLNPQAPDFARVLDRATVDIQFPSPQARDHALSWEVEDLSDEADVLVSTGAVRLWMAGHALCAWSDTWATSIRAGDVTTQERATEVILGARGWSAIADTGLDGEAAWIPALENAVRTQDTSAASGVLSDNAVCLTGLAPELGLGRRR